MQTIKLLNTAAAFFIEMAMLIALAVAGFHAVDAIAMRYILCIGLPLLAILVWAAWAAPKSSRRLSYPWLNFFKLTLFSVTVVLLFLTGYTTGAFVFGVLSFLNEILAIALRDK